MNIVLLGIQGCGKGTLVENLRGKLDFALISVGQLLRDEVKAGSKLGQQIHEAQTKGVLVDFNIVMDILGKRLNDVKEKNIIFDGFPRNVEQAIAFDKMLRVDKVIYLNLSEELAQDRLLNRLTCINCGYVTKKTDRKDNICPKCGGQLKTRSDDTIDSIKKRFEIYKKETNPLIKIYRSRGVLYEIDASRTPSEITLDVLKVIE